jgi:antibiotic biosynthesis monooxygenase (ABM) superfamily enzyme
MTQISRRTQPVRWKLWLLIVATLYPVITVGVTLAEPVLRRLPLAGRFALIVPVMVALMVWIVIPALHRLFGSWLLRSPAAGQPTVTNPGRDTA